MLEYQGHVPVPIVMDQQLVVAQLVQVATGAAEVDGEGADRSLCIEDAPAPFFVLDSQDVRRIITGLRQGLLRNPDERLSPGPSGTIRPDRESLTWRRAAGLEVTPPGPSYVMEEERP
ncbi:hypothetical protein NDU88_005633 [Pleurodeles waltl]|uniref:Uncharacterized protein n=1 Tax=Pleurodeles waltl TaxID=8319 RepID=A0AAV7RKQ9_PLEWA|nr:hypothetical protein NDU88_005633 [Pleurodeles waltl]